jgi:hypothetical protein
MNKLLTIKQAFLTALCLVAGITASYGQDTFRYQSSIEEVGKSGFYKIHLQPVLIAKGKQDLSDLRIIDNKNKFVPFVRMQNVPSKAADFLALPIVNSSLADSVTTLIVENKDSLLLQSLWLKVKNTAVYRKADLLGSDDQQNWFAIQEDVALDQSSGSTTDSYLQSLSFPASNYRFLKIKINNGRKEAIKILKVGVFSNKRSVLGYVDLPAPQFLKTDSSNKSTYLRLSFKDNFLISKLKIHVTSPKFYKREVLIFGWEGSKKRLIGETTLQSGSKQEILIGAKAMKLELQIFNGDNPPLEIDKVLASEVKEYIFAYLEANTKYQLLVDDIKALMPDYDLKFFADSNKSLPEIQHSAIQKNALLKEEIKGDKPNYTPFVWLAIIVVLALLSFLSWRMMTEMKARNS